jgi:hypothetical protein
MAFSDTLRETFFDRGTVRLTRAFPESDAWRMVDRIWILLSEKYGVRRDNPATWTENQPTGFQSLTRLGAFNPIVGPALIDALKRPRWQREVELHQYVGCASGHVSRQRANVGRSKEPVASRFHWRLLTHGSAICGPYPPRKRIAFVVLSPRASASTALMCELRN